MRIAIVGAGAIGSYYGAKLGCHGRDVHFLLRSGFDEILRDGIRVRGKSESFHLTDVRDYKSTRGIGRCDLVLIAIKATANEALLELIPPLLHEGTALLTLQNGFGNDEFLTQHFGAGRVLGGLCFICLNRVAPGVIEHFDYGHINIGEFEGEPRPRTYDIVAEFQKSGVICRAVENLACERWRKLVWNIPFNGLTIAMGGITTEEILRDDALRSEALNLMDELINAANKCGCELPAATSSEQMTRTETMGAYKPSTLLDFEAGRALEIEAIWGEPLRRAEAAGARMPRLAQLYQRLKALEASRR